METEHIRRLQIMSEEDFRALLDDLADHSRPIQQKLDFAQELTKSGLAKSCNDESNLSRKLVPKKNSPTSGSKKNGQRSLNDNTDSDSTVDTTNSSTKSMCDLRDNHDHNQQTAEQRQESAAAESIPAQERIDTQRPNNERSDDHSARRTLMTGNNLYTISGVRDSYVNNQIDDSDPSAGIDFFPTTSPNYSSKHCCQPANASHQSDSASSQQADSYLNNNNSNSVFSGRDSLRDLERCVEQISPAGAPIYDSVCRLNRNSVSSSSNNSTYRRFNRLPDEDDSDKMEFGESHNFERQSRIEEFHRNFSPVNKDARDGRTDSLLNTQREPENLISEISKSRRNKKKPQVKKAEEIPGHVGLIDINLLDSFIKGEKNRQEIIAGAESTNGDKSTNNGTSPENGQEPKKNKKKLKKKLNRDNRSVSEKNLPVNKQNSVARSGKSSSKPVSSNEASSSDVDELSPPSSSQTLQVSSNKSQSLFLAEYEFVTPNNLQELDELQTVSDPEVEREKEFVTPKNKTFKKNKKVSPKVPNDSTSFDSRRGFSKRELKRDRPNNPTLHNGYESEKDVHGFVPEALNIPLKITARNVIAPTSRVLPIVLDEPDLPSKHKARSASFDSEGQLQQGNIVNGYFPRINNDFVIVEPQAPPPNSGTPSYAQIAKNIAAAEEAATAASTSNAPSASPNATTNNSALLNNNQKSHKPEKKSQNNSLSTNTFTEAPVDDKTMNVPESQSNIETNPSIEANATATATATCNTVTMSSYDDSLMPNSDSPGSQPLLVTCSGDNLFTVETVSFQNGANTDTKRFMFGNFDNEEIDSVLQGATFSPLDDCFPRKRAKSVEAPRSPTVAPLAGVQRPPSSTDGHNSSSPVINYQHLSTSSPLSSPSNLDSSITSSSFKSNTTGSDTASSGFDQQFADSRVPVAEILPVLKPVPFPILSGVNPPPSRPSKQQRQPAPASNSRLTQNTLPETPFVSCVSQLENFRFVDPIDKNSFNYYAAVNFVRDSWIEFSRLKTV